MALVSKVWNNFQDNISFPINDILKSDYSSRCSAAFQIWQVPRQHCCRGTCQIRRLGNYKFSCYMNDDCEFHNSEILEVIIFKMSSSCPVNRGANTSIFSNIYSKEHQVFMKLFFPCLTNVRHHIHFYIKFVSHYIALHFIFNKHYINTLKLGQNRKYFVVIFKCIFITKMSVFWLKFCLTFFTPPGHAEF